MNTRVLNAVSDRLSLRSPQEESLSRLARAIEVAPELLDHERDVASVLDKLKGIFSTLEDFEREFPSLCFALATGVGKTRLMGAFIAYLHLAHGLNNFFILAPNLTIYNKLITDFTPNTAKYVFKGIAEFAQASPEIITGDNYEQRGAALGLLSPVTINIFNISKINSEVRGGKEPRIKRMREVLGDSYFNYLANLSDLVLLMDESHRYRASAGVRAINELKPLFGLELTATPFVESTKGPVQFKNVVMDYPLARAMEDGFVKEPAVVTQRNFNASVHTPEEVEKIKLEDGIRLHEATKVELLTYARENEVSVVKPFMLVIARDTTHAAQLLALLESDAFYKGRYKGKVIQVDSSRTGAEEEEMITRLLAVESVDEPTEIVIHVNMLKEGWDVTNLYTIVPLRPANARTLIEQSIGRGLRLPYGKRTGAASIDRLNIIAHDKFQEIVDEANRTDSPIRLKQVILEAPSDEDNKVSVQISSVAMLKLGLAEIPESLLETEFGNEMSFAPKLVTEAEQEAGRIAMRVIATYDAKCDLVPSSDALRRPAIQKAIVAEVAERLKPHQSSLLADETKIDLAAVVAITTEAVAQQIDIPRITVVPSGEVTTGFHPFKLDISRLRLQPEKPEIVGQMLRTNEQFIVESESGFKEKRLEDYIIHALVDFDDIDYFAHADLLYDLAGQTVKYLLSYLSEDDARNVLNVNRRLIASEIHAQMMKYFWEKAAGYEVRVSHSFTPLKNPNYAFTSTPHHFRDTVVDAGRIKQMIFGGFKRCLHPFQKFDSDTERRFSIILERDSLKWFKPVKGQFQIYYKLGTEHPEYIPDFVAEVDSIVLMVETKARGDLQTQETGAKARSAAHWCKLASDYAAQVGSKPWKFLLLPHDEINESKRLVDFLRYEVKVSE